MSDQFYKLPSDLGADIDAYAEDARRFLAGDLPAGGIRVRMIRLNEQTVRTNILQPPAYEMASTYEEWLPPEFHGKYQIERQKEATAKRREEREAERSANRDNSNTRNRSRGGSGNQLGQGGRNSGAMGNDSGRRGRRGSTAGNDRNNMQPGGRNTGTNDRNTRGRAGRAGQRGGGGDDLYGQYGAMPGARGDLLGQGSPLDEVFEAFEEIRLSPMKEFSRLDEIVFWSHDDSMESGKTYRYRIRLGVLNPAAGRDYVSQADIAFKDQVILWSDFSPETERVEIPERLYFFANTFQAVSNALSVEVAKFNNGYWRSEIFSVKPGESIGRLVEVKQEEDEKAPQYGGSRNMMGFPEPEPEMIDFSTNVVFVAAERVNRWVGGKTLRAQVSFDMLYSNSGLDIERLPIGSKNWPDRLSAAYGIVKRLQKEPIEDVRSFGSSRTSSNAMGLGGQMGMGRGMYGR